MAILIPVLLGVGLRVTGSKHGAPDLIYHPDVFKQALVARAVFAGDPDLRRLHRDEKELTLYPYGVAVLTGWVVKGLSWIAGSGFSPDEPLWNWDLRMRYVSASMYLVASVVVLISLRRRMTALGLFFLGGLLLTEPLNAQYSHYAMNDVPLAAVFLLAWLTADKMTGEGRWPVWSFFTGLLLGLGFGIKYQALIGMIFPLMA